MALEYAARNNLELDRELTFEDLGVSAFRGANAEAGRLADFLEAVQAGQVSKGSVLLVEALDRISRLSPRKALRVLEDIVDAGVTVVTLNDGKAYSPGSLDADPMSLLTAIIVFMRANEESATKARRLKAAWEGKRKVATTKPMTASVPAWIRLNRNTDKLELIPERAKIVRRVFANYLAGFGYHGIADMLNKDGIPCFGGAMHWHRTYVSKMLSNPATYGTFIPHEYVYVGTKQTREPLEPMVGYFPAAVSAEVFTEAQALRNTKTTPKVRAGVLLSLVAGLATCPVCSGTMTRVNKGPTGGRPKLVCARAKAGAGCAYRGVDVAEVEAAILEGAELLVRQAPSGLPEDDGALEQLLNNIDAAEDAQGNLIDAIAASKSKALLERLRSVEEFLEDARQARDALLQKLDASTGLVLTKRLDGLAAALASAPLDRLKTNAALRQLLASVVIDYERGELRLQWKHGGESTLTYNYGFVPQKDTAPARRRQKKQRD